MNQPLDFTTMFETEIVRIIRVATAENFLFGRTPDGRPWDAVTQFTLDHRENSAKHDDELPLQDTGHLMGQALFNPEIVATPDTLHYIVDVPYAARHQFGGESESGKQVPQRKFLGWTPEMIAEAKKAVGAEAAAQLRARFRRAG